MPAVLLGEKDITENVQPQALDKTTHKTAFMVLIDHNGNYVFEPDINKPVTTDRMPTSSEVKGALSALRDEITTQETAILAAQLIMSNLQMQAQAAFDAQQNQQVLHKIGMRK